MYQKSVNAGSQSGISSRVPTEGDETANGAENEASVTKNVKTATTNYEPDVSVGKHNGNFHQITKKPCLHHSNVVSKIFGRSSTNN